MSLFLPPLDRHQAPLRSKQEIFGGCDRREVTGTHREQRAAMTPIMGAFRSGLRPHSMPSSSGLQERDPTPTSENRSRSRTGVLQLGLGGHSWSLEESAEPRGEPGGSHEAAR